jgi:hypothetical protein
MLQQPPSRFGPRALCVLLLWPAQIHYGDEATKFNHAGGPLQRCSAPMTAGVTQQ